MTQNQLLTLAINKAGSVAELARLNNIEPPRIHEWKRGFHKMRFETMIKLLTSVEIEITIK